VKAIGAALQAVPSLNVRLVRGREYPRESIDVFVIVAVDHGELTGIKISDVDRKSVVEIAQEVEAHSARIRRGEDEQLGKTKKMMTLLPRHVLRHALRLSAWLTSDLHVDLPQYGLPRDAFGSAMVSAIGSTGIAHAYSPLAPYYRVPLLVLVGAVHEKPVAVSGQVVARPVLTLTATFDHRYTDGLAAADFARAMAAYLRDPVTAEAVPVPRTYLTA
jgi:pyruvate dehydrogenase E2 component (dihydrolipoamide acetyltransferase)